MRSLELPPGESGQMRHWGLDDVWCWFRFVQPDMQVMLRHCIWGAEAAGTVRSQVSAPRTLTKVQLCPGPLLPVIRGTFHAPALPVPHPASFLGLCHLPLEHFPSFQCSYPIPGYQHPPAFPSKRGCILDKPLGFWESHNY